MIEFLASALQIWLLALVMLCLVACTFLAGYLMFEMGKHTRDGFDRWMRDRRVRRKQ